MPEVSLPTAETRRRVSTPLPGRVDVAVIGAGLGGLMAAAHLARQGRSVAVFDAHYVAGGCCTQFSRGSGAERYHFDIGLHYVGDCGPGGRIPTMLRAVGVEVDFRPMDPDGFDTLVLPGLRFRIPADRELYRERLVALFPGERRGIDRYLRLLREVEALAGGVGRGGFALFKTALLHGRLAARQQDATIGAFLDDCTREPTLRAILLGQHGDYGLPPSKVSAMLHCGLANHYFAGAYYPVGGGQVIADRLAAVVEAAGGTIHLRHPVRGIEVDAAGRACGLRLSTPRGEEQVLPAGAVLSNADLKQTLLELVPPGHLPAADRARAEGFEMGGALYITCLAVTADMAAKGMTATNYWQSDSTDVEAMYQEATLPDGSPMTRGCYVTSATFKDPDTPGHAPPGVTSIEVMTLVPGRPAAWGVDPAQARGPLYRGSALYQARKASVEQQLVDRLEALFPGTAETIVFRESASPVSHTRFTWASEGSGYGIAATPAQFLRKRPGYRGPLPGLYLCGSSTRAGHGVVSALQSGEKAAKRILADG
jgi:all-trans-retinol 13,14-reductase